MLSQSKVTLYWFLSYFRHFSSLVHWNFGRLNSCRLLVGYKWHTRLFVIAKVLFLSDSKVSFFSNIFLMGEKMWFGHVCNKAAVLIILNIYIVQFTFVLWKMDVIKFSVTDGLWVMLFHIHLCWGDLNLMKFIVYTSGMYDNSIIVGDMMI